MMGGMAIMMMALGSPVASAGPVALPLLHSADDGPVHAAGDGDVVAVTGCSQRRLGGNNAAAWEMSC
jgi:hypothetical protein